MSTGSYIPQIDEIYRLPFSKNDNPNGWVEITTVCNLSCPGCYRGCDRPDINELHKSLEDIKNEIIELERIRNCDIISISGGEPFLHPDLLEIVKFVRDKGMQPFVHTNGTFLKPEILRSLKDAGLLGLIVRVDSLRSPEKKQSEKQLNKMRQKYAKMIKEIGGIHLSFISVVGKKMSRR